LLQFEAMPDWVGADGPPVVVVVEEPELAVEAGPSTQ
jgi:hypothetical protein